MPNPMTKRLAPIWMEGRVGPYQHSQQEFQEHLEAENLSSRKSVGVASRFGALEKFEQPCGHVMDEDRLEPRQAPTDQRRDGTAPNHGDEAAEEVIIRGLDQPRSRDIDIIELYAFVSGKYLKY
jgi:hypothetical protein